MTLKEQAEQGDIDYALAQGATLENIGVASAAGIGVWHYGCAIGMRVTHADLMAAHAAGAYLFHYALARSEGGTHEQAIEATTT